MNDSRGNWYLLTGLLIGIGMGVLIGWVISPVNYTDTAPYALQQQYKDEYRKLIAQAFLANGDIGRARERLTLLQDADPVRELSAQAQRLVAGGGLAADSSALSALAAALSAAGTSMTQAPKINTPVVGVPATAISSAAVKGTGALPSSTQVLSPRPPATLSPLAVNTAQAVRSATPIPSITPVPSITPTPLATFTPRPSPTRLVYDFPFVLRGEKSRMCDSSLPAGLLQIYVTNNTGKPLPGVRIIATWKDGEDSFYTGLYPEITPGYADFVMSPDKTYTLKVGDISEPVRDLSIPTCTASGRTFQGGWKLEFTQK